jgi:hypothetical protein
VNTAVFHSSGGLRKSNPSVACRRTRSPVEQNLGKSGGERNGLARSFSLHFTGDLINHGAVQMDFMCVKVNIAPSLITIQLQHWDRVNPLKRNS